MKHQSIQYFFIHMLLNILKTICLAYVLNCWYQMGSGWSCLDGVSSRGISIISGPPPEFHSSYSVVQSHRLNDLGIKCHLM